MNYVKIEDSKEYRDLKIGGEGLDGADEQKGEGS